MSLKSGRKRRIYQEKRMAELAEIRRQTEKWFPIAADLRLPYVPQEHREEIRALLAPALLKMRDAGRATEYAKYGYGIPVQAGRCWQVAQALIQAVDNPRCEYVEGVWIRPWELEEGEEPAPHAWVHIDDYRVDLIGEFFSWSSDDSDWAYEVQRVYSFDEFKTFIDKHYTNPLEDLPLADYGDITSCVWQDEGGQVPEHLDWKNEPSPKNFGQPKGNYTTNRAAYEVWLKSPAHDEYDEAQTAWEEERNRYLYSQAFKDAAERMRLTLGPKIEAAA